MSRVAVKGGANKNRALRSPPGPGELVRRPFPLHGRPHQGRGGAVRPPGVSVTRPATLTARAGAETSAPSFPASDSQGIR